MIEELEKELKSLRQELEFKEISNDSFWLSPECKELRDEINNLDIKISKMKDNL